MNKPGWLVCHPSKNGPWSSLVGAGREYTGADRLYLAGRLDRETSGVVLLGKNPEAGKTWQMAVEKRQVSRSYLAILKGELKNLKEVETHIGNDPESPVFVKQRVTQPSRKSKLAQTCQRRRERFSRAPKATSARTPPSSARLKRPTEAQHTLNQ